MSKNFNLNWNDLIYLWIFNSLKLNFKLMSNAIAGPLPPLYIFFSPFCSLKFFVFIVFVPKKFFMFVQNEQNNFKSIGLLVIPHIFFMFNILEKKLFLIFVHFLSFPIVTIFNIPVPLISSLYHILCIFFLYNAHHQLAFEREI